MTENKTQLTEGQSVGIVNEEGGIDVVVVRKPNGFVDRIFVRRTDKSSLGYYPVPEDKVMLPLPGFENILKGQEPDYLGLTTDLMEIPAADLTISERINAGIRNFQKFITGDRRR